MEEMRDIINFDVTYAHFVFDQRRNVCLCLNELVNQRKP